MQPSPRQCRKSIAYTSPPVPAPVPPCPYSGCNSVCPPWNARVSSAPPFVQPKKYPCFPFPVCSTGALRSAPSPSVQITLPQGRIQLILMSKNAAGNHKIKRLDMSKTAIRNEVTHAINIDELDHIFDTDRIIK